MNDKALLQMGSFFVQNSSEFSLVFDGQNYSFSTSCLTRQHTLVEQIDKEDPWVRQVFNIKGPGEGTYHVMLTFEGLVWYPIACKNAEGLITFDYFSNFVFKTKGESHRGIKSNKSASIAPEVAESADKFAQMMVTEARLEQGEPKMLTHCSAGLTEIGGGINKKLTQQFVGWILNDVNKEGKDELEVSHLDWKDVTKKVSERAVKWYMDKVTTYQNVHGKITCSIKILHV